MNKINYLSNSQTYQNGKFPVTIQGLEFIQKQINLLQNIAFVGADSYVLKPSALNQTGVCVINGEVLPLSGVKSVRHTHILINTAKETIRTDSGDYTDVREVRTAVYGIHANGAAYEDTNALPVGKLQVFKTNAYLWERLQELLNNPTETGLPVEVGQFTLEQLNNKKTPARLFCHSSATVGGSTSYTVDVYACNGVVFQELKGSDLRRYGRYLDTTTDNWGKFQPIDDQNIIEAKVIRGTLYLRHGFLPPYAEIIVLRKKRRNKNAGAGRKVRSVKCGWYHGWKIRLSKGDANKWYVPKCIAADNDYAGSTGKEFAPLMTELLFKTDTVGTRSGWRIAGVKKKWSETLGAYAKIAIAVINSESHNTAPQNVTRLKFRVWTQSKRVKTCLSIE